MDRKKEILRIIVDKICGHISIEDEAALDAWRKSDDSHERTYRQIMESDDLEERYREYADIDYKSAWSKFRKANFPRPSFRVRIIRRAVSAAAAIALLIGGYVLYHNVRAHDTEPQPDMAQTYEPRQIELSYKNDRQNAVMVAPDNQAVRMEGLKDLDKMPREKYDHGDYVLVTGKGNEFWITLEDGSIVHLNYNTRLRFPAHFASDSRTVYLEGEAYFKIAKDADRPFMVVTDNATIKQYGTEFSVNTAGGCSTKVALVRGSISVIKGENEYPVSIGEIAEISPSQINITKTDITPSVAWDKGEFVFQDCTLDKLMNVLEQWYGLTVEIESDELRDIKFSGNIDKYCEVDHLLHAIEKIMGLEIINQSKMVTIKKINYDENQ